MRVYLLRHGIAEDPRPGQRDSQRRLTKEGIEKLRKVLEIARGAGVAPEMIWTSPLVRAAETGRIAAAVLEVDAIEEADELLPSASPEQIWGRLRRRSELKSVLLVGHEPSLGLAASFLLGCPHPIVEVKKGALLCLEADVKSSSPRGVLRWLITAKLAGAADEPV